MQQYGQIRKVMHQDIDLCIAVFILQSMVFGRLRDDSGKRLSRGDGEAGERNEFV